MRWVADPSMLMMMLLAQSALALDVVATRNLLGKRALVLSSALPLERAYFLASSDAPAFTDTLVSQFLLS